MEKYQFASAGPGLTLDSLKHPHFSRPRNPIIADVCFKGGYIDAWGRVTVKIIDTCKQAGLPESELKEQDGGFSFTLFKNNLSEEQLIKLGLNGRQIKAVLFVQALILVFNCIFIASLLHHNWLKS